MAEKKLIIISGSPCVGKTAVARYLFDHDDNSAYCDGDWCWCVIPFSVGDKRLRNGDKNMSFLLSTYLRSGFRHVYFASVVATDFAIRDAILRDITADGYDVLGFTLTCSEETLRARREKRGDEGEISFYWLRLPPYPTDTVIQTDGRRVSDIARDIRRRIDASDG